MLQCRRALLYFGLALLSTTAAFGQLPAFPGAEGFGRFATGGRGGSVYYVTNLNNSGAGSFRDAVSQPNRTVVFSVSGVIDYQSPRYNIQNNVTIAGQTAPGDGVVLYGDGIGFTGSDHTITRFIRFRMGHDATGEDTVGIADGHDMIFDHISATWSLDEVFSISGSSEDPTNITIQASIVGQGLQDHSAGGLIQTDGGVSILRCLYIDNGTRNPKVKGINEFVNNVIYNWEVDAYILGDSAGPSYANVIGNYFINGPGSGNDDAFSRGNLNFNLYATNNWQDKNRNGILDGVLLAQSDYDVNVWQPTPYPWPVAVSNTLPPLTAVKVVVGEVGPSWRRDTVDERLVTELTSWGTLGETIFTEFDAPMNGPGPFKGGPVPLDSDLDGMPDYWEAGLGTSTNAANNNEPSPTGSGYTRLEDYLNWLAEPHGVALTNTIVDVDLRQFTRGFLNTSPVYSVTNATNGTVTLVSTHIARFTPNTGFIGQAGFRFSVVDSQGSTIARPMNLFFTPQPPAYGRIWRGDDAANNWNVAGDANWFDEQALLYPFRNGNAVAFDDTGSTNPAVNLVGSIQPALVTVNSTRDYTFSGGGSLDGAMALIKAGSGKLALANTNNFSGPTTVSNGTLLVHGSLPQSVVSVRTGATLGGNGRVGLTPVLVNKASLAPGGGIGSPGTLTFDTALTLPGGVTARYDLSDDPTGSIKTNDQMIVAGTLTATGKNFIRVNLVDGPLSDGHYTLIQYGGFAGNLTNFALINANGVLTNPPGEIAIHVHNFRTPGNLKWVGNGSNNTWDQGVTTNWLNAGIPDVFYFFDAVEFEDTGSTNPPVNLVGSLTPSALTMNATKNYTFSGPGSISGYGTVTKTNTGMVTMLATNDYAGPTVLAGGTLSVPLLSNSEIPGPLGAAESDPDNLIFSGGTLRFTGSNGGTDHGATLATSGTIEVTNPATVLTWSGVFTGGGSLRKTGRGRLDLSGANTYTGGTIVEGGTVFLANVASFGSGAITLNGTTNSATFHFGSNPPTLDNPLNITGTNNFTVNNGNNTVNTMTGNGTLTLNNGTTFTFAGNMSGFSGTIIAGTLTNPRFNGSSGSSNALFDLANTSAILNVRNGGSTIQVGALKGSANTQLQGASSINGLTTYVIGGRNLDTTFSGRITEIIPARTAAITKVGTGTFTLTGASTHTGATIVNGGTLLVNNTTGTGTGTNSVTVNSGGTLGGTGFIYGPVIINSGGALSPGASVGTLTLRSNLTLNSGSVLRFELGLTNASDRVAVSNNLVLGGTLHITNVAGFGEGTYTLITRGGALSGVLPVIGSKPAGFSCTVNTNTPGQVRLVVQAQSSPTIGSVMVAGGSLVLSGSNGPANSSYYVLSSTNLAMPFAGWAKLATNQFNGAGNFAFTNAVDTSPQRFYLLQLP